MTPFIHTPRRCLATVLAVVLVLCAAHSALAQETEPVPATPVETTSETQTAPAETSKVDENEDLLAGEDGPAQKPVDLPDMSKALVKMVVFMMILLALLVAGVIVFQRYARGKISLTGAKRPLRMIDRLSLGPKSGVCLVNACGRYLVLGISEKEVSVLLEVPITNEDEAESQFSEVLAKFDPAAKPESASDERN